MKQVMIDLETMGTRPDSAIVAIGAVLFDLPTLENPAPKLGKSFYRNVDLQSSIDAGLTVTGDTVYWWLQQEEAARNRLLDNRATLSNALHDFSEFFTTDAPGLRYPGAEYLWAHGLDFDVGIMRSAYDNLQIKHPWYYNKVRDDRTLYEVTGQPPWDELKDILQHSADMCPHNALYDAKLQALGAIWAMNTIHMTEWKASRWDVLRERSMDRESTISFNREEPDKTVLGIMRNTLNEQYPTVGGAPYEP